LTYLKDAAAGPALSGVLQGRRQAAEAYSATIWVDPLLRYDAFEPKTLGIRAMLPHVNEFRPVHNLASMADLFRALSSDRGGRTIRKRG